MKRKISPPDIKFHRKLAAKLLVKKEIFEKNTILEWGGGNMLFWKIYSPGNNTAGWLVDLYRS